MGKLILAALVAVLVVWVAGPHKNASATIQPSPKYAQARDANIGSTPIDIFQGAEKEQDTERWPGVVEVPNSFRIWKAPIKLALSNQFPSVVSQNLGDGLEFSRAESHAIQRSENHSIKRPFEVYRVCDRCESNKSPKNRRLASADISQFIHEAIVRIYVHIFENKPWSMFGKKLEPSNFFLFFDNIGLSPDNSQLFFSDFNSVNSGVGGSFNVFGLVFGPLGEPLGFTPKSDGGGGEDEIKQRLGPYQEPPNPKPKGTNWPLVAGIGVGGAILVAIGGWSRIYRSRGLIFLGVLLIFAALQGVGGG